MTGALKALDFGLGPIPAALMGMLTGIGGGMLRDVLAGRVPLVFRGDLYATPPWSARSSRWSGTSSVCGPRGGPARRAVCFVLAGAGDAAGLERAARERLLEHLSAHQNMVPGSPLKGPTTCRGHPAAVEAARLGLHDLAVHGAAVHQRRGRAPTWSTIAAYAAVGDG